MYPRPMPTQVAATLAHWITHYRRWWKYHYILGILALFCSITVASRPQLQAIFPTQLIDVLAWVSALAVGLITFLTPSKKARSYVSAARLLSDARNRYESDHDYPVQKLLDAVKDGEDLIARADPL